MREARTEFLGRLSCIIRRLTVTSANAVGVAGFVVRRSREAHHLNDGFCGLWRWISVYDWRAPLAMQREPRQPGGEIAGRSADAAQMLTVHLYNVGELVVRDLARKLSPNKRPRANEASRPAFGSGSCAGVPTAGYQLVFHIVK